MTKKLLMTASGWDHLRRFHLPYLRQFRALGWEVHIACADAPENEPLLDRAVELPFKKRLSAPANFQAAQLLRALIAAESYDLIVAHTSLASFFTRLAVKGVKDRPRLVVVMHGYLFDDETPLPRRRLLLDAERLTAPETDLLLTMNAWDRRTAERCRLGRRIAQIPGMGVDYTALDAAPALTREECGIPEDAFVLLCAAEFSPRKSQAVLIRAMAELPENVVLLLCGDGAQLSACQSLADRLGLSGRVLFPGRQESMGSWYRLADAAVAASRSEGLPFNVMEAMHSGLPVVASAVKGHSDLLVPGGSGLLYPYGDAAACAACVRRLLLDRELRRRLGQGAAAAAKQYRLEAVLPRVMALYLSETTNGGAYQ